MITNNKMKIHSKLLIAMFSICIIALLSISKSFSGANGILNYKKNTNNSFEVTILNNNGKSVPNYTLTILKSNKKIKTLTTNKNGVASTNSLKNGSYKYQLANKDTYEFKISDTTGCNDVVIISNNSSKTLSLANTSIDPIQCKNNTKNNKKNNTKVVQSNLAQEDIFLDKNNKSDGLVLKVRVVEKKSNTPVLGAKIKVTNISTNKELTSFSMKSPVTFIRGINKSQYKVELVTIPNGYKAISQSKVADMRNLKKSDGAPTAIMYLAKDSSSNNNNNTTSDTVEETKKDTIQETKKDTVQITVNILDSDTNKPLENASIQLDTSSKENFYNYKTTKYSKVFRNLSVGKYTFKVTNLPKGYTLDENYITDNFNTDDSILFFAINKSDKETANKDGSSDTSDSTSQETNTDSDRYDDVNTEDNTSSNVKSVSTVGKITTSHPRLFVTKKDIANIKKNLTNSYNKVAWDRLLYNYKKYNLQGGVTKALPKIQAAATIYLIKGDKEAGKNAINWYKSLIPSYNNMTSVEKDAYSRSQYSVDVLVTAAMVYDWCYDLASSSDRAMMRDNMFKVSKYLETGYPFNMNKLGAVTSHASGRPILVGNLAAGIAMYDEDPSMYNLVAKALNEKYIPARRFLSTAGMHYQGQVYSWARFNSEIIASSLLNTIGYPNVFGPEHSNTAYQWIYGARPDGQQIRNGDMYKKAALGEKWTSDPACIEALIYCSHLSKDPYILGQLEDNSLKYRDSSMLTEWRRFMPTIQILYLDESSAKKSVSDLPLTKFYGSPIGYMVARTGWGDTISSNTAMATFKVGEYKTFNHEHADNGQFELYYKGGLAVDSGIYEGIKLYSNGKQIGGGGYNGIHDRNYNKRTIAHNCLLVYNPNEKFGDTVNDGGQKTGGEMGTIDQIKSKYHFSDIISSASGPNAKKPIYSYMKGDLTNAYTQKITSYQRGFLFINTGKSKEPATAIVIDNVSSSDANYKKYFLIHTVEKPTYSGNVATIRRTTKGRNGKLINTTLTPKIKTEIIGGKGNEFNVFGKNFPSEFSNNAEWNSKVWDDAEPGTWRVQISPKNAQKTDTIINVMQMMDNDFNTSIKPSHKETSDYHLINLKNQAVVVIKSGSANKKSFNIDLSGENLSSTYDLIIVDASFGTWKVNNATVKTSKSDSVIYQRTSDKKITLSK